MDAQIGVAAELQRLLDELCARLGLCLPPATQKRLSHARPPFDVDEFTDAVFVAEGMDPRLEKTFHRHVRQRVRQRLNR